MIAGIDHALIAVEDVEAAMATYRALGFRVWRGGTHPHHGTQNALVPLSDGFYLELMGVWDRSLASRHPHTNQVVQSLADANRLALFALDSDDLDADVEAIRRRGLPISDPVPGERERPDGERVAWRTAHPEDPRLPFLIEDVTPRSVRVPEADEGVGAELRIARLIIGASDATGASEALERLLGGRADQGSLETERGAIGLASGSSSFALERLVLAADGLRRLAEFWSARGVPFVDSETHTGKRLLIPQETAGISFHVIQLAR